MLLQRNYKLLGGLANYQIFGLPSVVTYSATVPFQTFRVVDMIQPAPVPVYFASPASPANSIDLDTGMFQIITPGSILGRLMNLQIVEFMVMGSVASLSRSA